MLVSRSQIVDLCLFDVIDDDTYALTKKTHEVTCAEFEARSAVVLTQNRTHLIVH